VVDNASTDTSRLELLDWFAKNSNGLHLGGVVNEVDVRNFQRNLKFSECIYIQASQNGGFAAGNNLGIRLALQAGCEYVWLLNNDTVVESRSLVALEECMASNPKVGMCGSILRYHDDRSVIQAVGGVRFKFFLGRGEQLGQGLLANSETVHQLAKIPLTYISGASLFVSAEFLKDVGLMEESYFLYFEEIDWAVRASKRWKIATAETSIVYHKEGGSIGSPSLGRQPSVISQYYLNRNLIRFYMLRKTWLLPIAILRVIRELINLVFKKKYALARITLRALLDGLLMRSGVKVA
jgi:GT2 family glycosyltransferase